MQQSLHGPSTSQLSQSQLTQNSQQRHEDLEDGRRTASEDLDSFRSRGDAKTQEEAYGAKD